MDEVGPSLRYATVKVRVVTTELSTASSLSHDDEPPFWPTSSGCAR